MNLSELWNHFKADKRIQGLSLNTLRAYALQLKMLVSDLGDVDISGVTLNLLKEYLAKQSDRLKPSSLGHGIPFVRSLFCFAHEETYLSSNPSIKLHEPKHGEAGI
ncbi:site-specific recombinase XerD [Paenibacillus sp. DS2363]|uniref:site-specific integrase n=2 Tax=Paenibacillus TaxID=44249 RepID=UPI0020A0CE33|nr:MULTISPECIES: site-specific integrase [Paenibacillus]MCP1427224.1 integrase/recombinase XerD [Paenibacillus xylanexedens]